MVDLTAPALAPLRRFDLVLCGLWLAVVAGWAVLPGVFSRQDPLAGVAAERLQPPSLRHLLGTDHLGRDLFARVVHGAALSLQAALIAVGVALVVGSAVGLAAGSLGRWADALIMRVVDVMLAIPALLTALALITALGFGTVQVAVAVGIATAATFARVMRAEVLRVRAAPYIGAARCAGSRGWWIALRHVLPNTAGPVLVLAALEFGAAILFISTLSFLGLGAAPPAPEWGALVSGGRNFLNTAWWLTTLPSLTVAGIVLAANRIARELEHRRD
ncbi:ABC transporter permease [Dactylosporangium siamense]|uniref:ABC transporter permease n=1 Tax=Dactylosporangium siamense TaxID=685454 RepID=A0A919PD72_9ACTN|nr:ABC transporter permease [Dactylosporangium siamense]GIG42616.1 ABC transporter permease [Dactylosporangium siamense]